MFTASLSALAAYGAALVALRVGRGSQVVAAREKGSMLEVDGTSLTAHRDKLRLSVTNVGAAPARWVDIGISQQNGFKWRHRRALLKANEPIGIAFSVAGSAPVGEISFRIDRAWRSLDDRVQRDARFISFDAGNVLCGERPVSTRWLVRLLRRMSGR